MRNKSSRRNFIKGGIILGGAFTLLPGKLFSASINVEGRTSYDERDLVFLFQGDSITDGNRGRDMDPNHIMGHGYAFSISSRIGTDFAKRNLKFYNRGISGNKLSDLKNRWEEDTIALKPDVLSILIGINDAAVSLNVIDKEKDLNIWEDTYRQLLTRSREFNPKLIIVLGIPFVFNEGKITKDWDLYSTDIAKRKAIVQKLAIEFDAVIVDYSSAFEEAFKQKPLVYWIWDGIHPTIFGHEIMTRCWLKSASKKIRFLKSYHA